MVVLGAGEMLRWPLAPPPAPPPPTVPDPPPPLERQPAPRRARDVAPLLDEIAALRGRGAYREAAARLEGALEERWPAATRERLSFELGAIATYHLGDAAQACSLWRAHERRYPGGRYAVEVEQARAELRCADEP